MIQCRQSNLGGLGLFAATVDNITPMNNDTPLFSPNDVVFSETPVETEIMRFSQLCKRHCTYCMRPLGTLRERVCRILSLNGSTTVLPSTVDRELNTMWLSLNKTYGYTTVAGDDDDNIDVKCTLCGANTCSQFCLERLKKTSWHHYTCDKIKQNNKAQSLWKQFVKFSYKHHEGFLLAAKIICRILHDFELSGFESKQQFLSFQDTSNLKWPNVHLEREQTIETNVSRSALTDDLNDQFKTSFALLHEFFNTSLTISKRSNEYNKIFSTIITEDFYNALLVQFDLVNAEVSLPDPLCNPLLECIIDTSLSTAVLEVFKKVHNILFPSQVEDNNPSMSLNEIIMDICEDTMGFSYCPVVGILNHSCSPNLVLDFTFITSTSTLINHHVSYNGDSAMNSEKIKKTQAPNHGVICIISALRNIYPDEELLISYIDESASLAKRSGQLRKNYGFLCRCYKCCAEAKQLLS